MKKIILFLSLLVIISFTAYTKAYFAGKKEMIKKAKMNSDYPNLVGGVRKRENSRFPPEADQPRVGKA